MAMQSWVRLPSSWIERGGLREIRWQNGGSDNIAAIMAWLILAHHADQTTGQLKMTYDELCNASSLSRAKLAGGLRVLEGFGIIDRADGQRSGFRLVGIEEEDTWGKLPAKRLYDSLGRVSAFTDFTLRRAAELNALKAYVLFAARRDRSTNMAHLTFDQITERAGIERAKIKAATSMLASLSLVYSERTPNWNNDIGYSLAYRLTGIDPYNHMGTNARANGLFE